MKQENLYTPDCIRTVSGIYVNVFDPKPEMFVIEDIAHALSMQPRFGGHLPHFYSVAQHSALTAAFVEEEYKLSALMHDASEAYLLDIPRPIKQRLSNYKDIEHGLMQVLSVVFGFQYPLPEAVKKADEDMLKLEWDSLMLQKHNAIPWMDQFQSKDFFLSAYKRFNDQLNDPLNP